MRIISGTKRGKKLKEPDNYDIRPTTDMVKESMFNIVQFDIEGGERSTFLPERVSSASSASAAAQRRSHLLTRAGKP